MIKRWLDRITQRAIVDGIDDYRIHLQRGALPIKRHRWQAPTFEQVMLFAATAVIIFGFSTFLIVAYATLIYFNMPMLAALFAPVAALLILAIAVGEK